MSIVPIIDSEFSQSKNARHQSVDAEVNRPGWTDYRVAGFFCMSLNWGGVK